MTPKTKNQDEEIIEKVLKEAEEYLNKTEELPEDNWHYPLVKFAIQKALSLYKEETKAKVEKLKKCFGSEWKFIHNKINEIFKETSEDLK